jgi:hypothetical protein
MIVRLKKSSSVILNVLKSNADRRTLHQHLLANREIAKRKVAQPLASASVAKLKVHADLGRAAAPDFVLLPVLVLALFGAVGVFVAPAAAERLLEGRVAEGAHGRVRSVISGGG